MEIFAVKWNVVSEISKVNDIFAELDGSSEIKNITSYTDKLNLGGLQVGRWDINNIKAESTKKLYQWGKPSFK